MTAMSAAGKDVRLMADARAIARQQEDAGLHGIANLFSRLSNEILRLQDAAKGSVVVVNQAIEAKRRAEVDTAALRSALALARNWMLCDSDFGDPEDFKRDLTIVDAALGVSL